MNEPIDILDIAAKAYGAAVKARDAVGEDDWSFPRLAVVAWGANCDLQAALALSLFLQQEINRA
jgi:hypothetical protein